jgi:uncharacterized protein
VRRNGWALMAAMVFPSLMAWLYFVALGEQTPTNAPPARSPVVAFAYAAAKIGQFAFPLIWVLAVERRRVRIAAPASRGLLTGLISGAAVGGTIFTLYWLVARQGNLIPLTEPVARLRLKVAQFGLDTPAAYIAFVIFLAGIHSFLEEYYWRWFVFGGLNELMPQAGAIALSSVAFMAHHIIDLAVFLPGNFWLVVMPMSLGVALGGAFWAWLYARTGSLYPAWLSHLLVDAAIMAVGYDLVFVGQASR